MPKLMLTLKLDPKQASFPNVMRRFGLTADEIDQDFGVVKISIDENLYAVLVDEAAVSKVSGRKGVKGPYANPKIEPFGPPK
jgi:hypothetical protein